MQVRIHDDHGCDISVNCLREHTHYSQARRNKQTTGMCALAGRSTQSYSNVFRACERACVCTCAVLHCKAFHSQRTYVNMSTTSTPTMLLLITSNIFRFSTLGRAPGLRTSRYLPPYKLPHSPGVYSIHPIHVYVSRLSLASQNINHLSIVSIASLTFHSFPTSTLTSPRPPPVAYTRASRCM